MTGHSRLFPPSGAARWINCTASAEAAARYRDEPGDAAMEGTAWHYLAETCLTTGAEPEAYLGRTITVREGKTERKFVVDRNMLVDTRMMVDYVRALVQTPGESHVESRVDLSHLHPDCFGRCDVWHLGVDGILTVADGKYGRVDVPVLSDSGTLNWQMVVYALGILEELSRKTHPHRMPDRIRLVIIQPRSLQPGPRIKYHTVPASEILALEAVVRQAIHNVVHNPTFKMGDWCKYCPALGQCPESQSEIKALAPVLLSTALSANDAGRILARKDLLMKIVKEAEKVAEETLLRGGEVPGFKLVTSRKHRQWSDEDAAADAAGSIKGAFSVVSPSQMEKLPGGRAIVDKYAIIPPGEPTVAKMDDKRAPYVAKTADQMFGGK